MGLELDESEEVEKEKINNEVCSKFVTFLFLLVGKEQVFNDLAVRMIITKHVFEKRNKAKEALNSAVVSGKNLSLWREAYHQAELAAKEEQLLFNFRLKLIFKQANKITSKLSYCKLILILARLYDKTLAQKTSGLILALILTDLLLTSPALLFDVSERFKLDLFGLNSPIMDEVLSAAKSAGVDLTKLSDKSLANSNSLINKLLNKDNNVQALEKINCTDVPEELCCIISMAAMTDPVYSEQHPMRFERAAILEWLQKRNIHPYTNQPLYIGDLKRDFALKRDIDKFVKKQQRKGKRTQDKSAMHKQFLFQSVDNDAVDDTLDVSDQEMLNSAFGQGSNTYKNFVNTRFGV